VNDRLWQQRQLPSAKLTAEGETVFFSTSSFGAGKLLKKIQHKRLPLGNSPKQA
jgi:hypothetical protein